jgi:hypothetical protein
VTGETWPTEHVMVPRLCPGETGDAGAFRGGRGKVRNRRNRVSRMGRRE